jgi:selenocysteine lyase/cysteine desulfurase
VCIAHVPTNGGLVNPAAELGRVIRSFAPSAAYILDACQSVGQVDIDVGNIGCDVLAATSRKYLRGPRGVGFLYVSKEAVASGRIGEGPYPMDHYGAPWVTGRSGETGGEDVLSSNLGSYVPRGDAKRYEYWESNVANVLGLGAAVDYCLEVGVPLIERRVVMLGETLRTELRASSLGPRVTIHDAGERRCGIVSFTISSTIRSTGAGGDVRGDARVDAKVVKRRLRARHINVAVSDTVSTRLDSERRDLPPSMLRASVHYYNTEAEVTSFVQQLADVVDEMDGEMRVER